MHAVHIGHSPGRSQKGSKPQSFLGQRTHTLTKNKHNYYYHEIHNHSTYGSLQHRLRADLGRLGQTWADFSDFDKTLIDSASGQDFTVGSSSFNLRLVSGSYTSVSVLEGGEVFRPVKPTDVESLVFAITFSDTGTVYLGDDETMNSREYASFGTNGSDWSLTSPGTNNVITGLGTNTVRITGESRQPPYGKDSVFSTFGATSLTWELGSAEPISMGAGLRVGFVPEPSSVTLLGLGGLALILRRRK